MPHYCCVKGCPNNSVNTKGSDIGYYQFPSMPTRFPRLQILAKERRRRWFAAIGKKSLDTKNARVCSRHFLSGKSAKISASTDPDWVPSLHMGENIDPLSDTRRLKKPLSKRRAETQQIRECQRKAVNAEFIKIDDDIDMDTDDKSEEEFLQDYLDEIRASQDDKETDGNNVSQDDDKSPEQRKKKKLHKVVVNCCVPMCKNARSKYKSKIMFFRFPKAEENNVNGKIYRNERQTAWINAIKRIDITHLNASNKIICSDHFITGAPAKDKSHPDWIPSQKLPLTLAKAVKQIETPDPLDEQEMQMHTINTVEEELKLNMDIIALQKEIEELKKVNADLKKQVETKDIIIADHVEEIRRLVETQVLKLNNKDKIIEQVQANHRRITLSRDGFKNDDKKVTYMTGLPSLAVLDIIYDYVKDDLVSSMMKGVNKFDALVMVLLKLRLDLPMCYLGYRFGIAGNTCARVFHKNLKVLCDKIGPFIRWPEKTQPECTAVYFKKVLGKRFTALIDFIEDPGPDVSAGHLVQNNYKRNKYLVAISPAGAIVFVSKGYDVNMSLKEIAESCGVLDYTDDGDIILSDYGKAAHQVLSYNGSKVIVPTNQENDLLDSLLQNPSHTNTDGQVEPDNSRIYIHRSLSVLKNRYFVLTNKYNHGVATKSYKISEGEHYFDYVVKVCCALTNVSPAIITLENKKS
ncbi:uncharacterized protein LOC129918365 isoform X3 [Episyrphus balteatus]|uniref:uncharacterized protein LOC129918365 isoform X3 n=1 Tax=Episyrphus balteatus TaxID=286459 RepID=UPI00248627D1|nr:uncharacterized protein LOC129918365 isoform X3 [Episyrphus balteatus]